MALRQVALITGSGAVAEDVVDPRPNLRLEAVGEDVLLTRLVDSRVEEERQDGGGRTVDRHRYRRRRVVEVETRVQLLGVVEGRHRNPGIAHLAIDVGPLMGIFAVERHRIERRRKPLGLRACCQVVETTVGLLGRTLAGEHPGRVLFSPLERIDAGGERELAGQVLLQ